MIDTVSVESEFNAKLKHDFHENKLGNSRSEICSTWLVTGNTNRIRLSWRNSILVVAGLS